MSNFKSSTLILLFVAVAQLSIGQIKTVTGTVKDRDGSPIIGASVKIKDSPYGVATDLNGKFTIKVDATCKVMLVSYLGYSTKEVQILKSVINIVLEESANVLEDVVVIGYGTQKKSDLTGSVSSIKSNDIQKVPVKSFDEAIAGKIAGVQVSSSDGQPGAGVNILIRGANSLNNSNAPLYVVDGFPFEDNDNDAINPADIERIDILKDASATAIYGARGANGVIMITTKRGNTGAPKISFDAYAGLQQVMKKTELLSPYEFVKLQYERNAQSATSTYLSNGRTLDYYKDLGGIDWQNMVERIAPTQNYNLSINGGNKETKYSVSGSIMDQQGIIINSGFIRYQGRISLDQDINRKMKIGATVNYTDSKSYGKKIATDSSTPSDGLMYSVWGYRPINLNSDFNIEDELFDQLVGTADTRVNPHMQLMNEVREQLKTNFLANGYFQYNIIDGFTLRITGGISKAVNRDKNFNNTKTSSGSPLNIRSLGVNATDYSTEFNRFSNENSLTYSHVFNKVHKLNIVGVYSQQYGNSNMFGAQSIFMPNESLGFSGMDEGTLFAMKSVYSGWALQSYLSRINYDYRSKYMFTASIRADGSSKFAKQNRWGYFPSAGLAYRISQEKFLQKNEFINDCKIRASYGETGNNGVSDFASLSNMTFSYNSYYSFGNTTPTLGTSPAGLGNADLTWETTQQTNFGIDMSLLKGKVSFTADYYNKITRDLLLNADIALLSGYSRIYKNIGKVQNYGLEFTLITQNVVNKKFNWSTNFNISFNKNKILQLADGMDALISISPNCYIANVGEPIAQFYGLISDGVYQYSDFNQLANGKYVLKPEVPSNGSNRASILPGNVKIKDLNHDGTISADDKTIIGDPNPDFNGGISNDFSYLGFDLSLFFQFSYGNQVMNYNRIPFEGYMGALLPLSTNMFATYVSRWSTANQNSIIPSYGSSVSSIGAPSIVVEDGSFLRLKTVSFGYSLPKRLLKMIDIKSLRLYATAQNIFTWTKYSGTDPDVSTRGFGLTPSYDYSAYPRSRTIIMGVNVTF